MEDRIELHLGRLLPFHQLLGGEEALRDGAEIDTMRPGKWQVILRNKGGSVQAEALYEGRGNCE